jgi:hypothetical protein
MFSAKCESPGFIHTYKQILNKDDHSAEVI